MGPYESIGYISECWIWVIGTLLVPMSRLKSLRVEIVSTIFHELSKLCPFRLSDRYLTWHVSWVNCMPVGWLVVWNCLSCGLSNLYSCGSTILVSYLLYELINLYSCLDSWFVRNYSLYELSSLYFCGQLNSLFYELSNHLFCVMNAGLGSRIPWVELIVFLWDKWLLGIIYLVS